MPADAKGHRSDAALPRSPYPSCAFYNIRFLRLAETSKDVWKQKIANVRALVQAHDVVCIFEAHADGAAADQFFFRHIDGVHVYHLADAITLLLRKTWAVGADVDGSKGDELGRSVETVVEGVMYALRFTTGDNRTGWVLPFRPDAKSEAERISQLREATQWVERRIRPADIVLFGGDRNHTLTREERASSALRPGAKRRCSQAMTDAWRQWTDSFGGRIVPQPEYTFHREGKEEATGRLMWCYEEK